MVVVVVVVVGGGDDAACRRPLPLPVFPCRERAALGELPEAWEPRAAFAIEDGGERRNSADEQRKISGQGGENS